MIKADVQAGGKNRHLTAIRDVMQGDELVMLHGKKNLIFLQTKRKLLQKNVKNAFYMFLLKKGCENFYFKKRILMVGMRTTLLISTVLHLFCSMDRMNA